VLSAAKLSIFYQQSNLKLNVSLKVYDVVQ
jgi:hypothetical protein